MMCFISLIIFNHFYLYLLIKDYGFCEFHKSIFFVSMLSSAKAGISWPVWTGEMITKTQLSLDKRRMNVVLRFKFQKKKHFQ